MMLLRPFGALALALVANTTFAQPNPYGCHYFRNHGHTFTAPTAAQRTQIDETIARSDTFDILHYDIAIDVTRYSAQTIVASTAVDFRALMPGQSFIRFDLFDLVVDSVTSPDGPMTFAYDGAFLKVELPVAPVVGEDQTLTVHYHGVPHRDPDWGGFYFESNYIYNLGIGLSTIPPNFGKVWYPCFDSFVERATYTYHVKSAGTFRLHGQGTFLGEEQLLGDTVIRSYDLAQPITTHLSAIAVADYQDSAYIHTGANGDIPVLLSAKPVNLPGMVARFGDLGAAIDACEYWYGPYPFERVGYVLTTDGALEIPTNVGYPDFMTTQSVTNNRGLFTHELGHHWWGDIVAPHIHNDMWLKEGPAEYSAHLIEEWLGGSTAFVKAVKDNQLFVLKQAHLNDGGFQALSPMPDEYIYGTHTYYKGAAVMHNLRGYLGDEVFRQAMRDVQAQYAYTDITAVGFKDALEAVTGEDLDPFFDAWVFAPGFAAFEIRDWSYVYDGPTAVLTLSVGQKLRGTTVYHTEVPLDLTVISASGAVFETSIVVSGEETSVVVNSPFVPAMMVLNRHNRLNQARMDEEITLVPGENFNTILPYTDFRIYENTLVDTTLVRIDHIWSAPDQSPVSADITMMSNTHYYNVDGLWPEGTSLEGKLYYYGNNANQLDHDLIDGDETGMVLVWRATPTDTWEVYWDQTANIGIPTNGSGNITMNTLEKGQYAFAKGAVAIGLDELSSDHGDLRLYPVPTQGTLTVGGATPVAATLWFEVFGIDGRLVQRSTQKASGPFTTSLDLAALVDGTYVLRVVTTTGKRIGTRRFELAR